MGGTTTAFVAEANEDPAQQNAAVRYHKLAPSIRCSNCSCNLETGENSSRSNCHYCCGEAQILVVRPQNFGYDVRQSCIWDTEFPYTPLQQVRPRGDAKSKSLLPRMKASLHHRKSLMRDSPLFALRSFWQGGSLTARGG